jgi:hypothetical protein
MPEPDYGAMTVNERLFVAGTLDLFDSAARASDRDSMVKLLMQVEIEEKEARQIIETILSNPKKYGF